MDKRIRVLIAKPGLDGHDRGALVIAQGLRDEGMEVIYSGLRQTPEQIVAAAIQEDVDCIGLSILSGAHNVLFPEIIRLLREQDAADILVVGGGVIPDEDIPYLKQQGIKGIFTSGTPMAEIATFIRANVGKQANVTTEPYITKIDHLGIAVQNLEQAIDFYKNTLNLEFLGIEEIEAEAIKVAFFKVGDIKLELMEPSSSNSPIAKFLASKGEGIHHLAFAVDDLNSTFNYFNNLAIPLLQDSPKIGAEGKKIGFVHPKATHKVLMEFCQKSGQK